MGIHAHSTTLSGATTGAIGTIQSINVSGPSRDSIDVSHFGSTDAYREFIPGMIDAGQISGTIKYDKSVVNTLVSGIESDAEIWTITFPDGSTFACSGFITAAPVGSGDTGSDLTGDFTIKLTGKPTFTAAT